MLLKVFDKELFFVFIMTKYITVLFQKHKKKLPKKFQGTFLDELIRYGFMTILSAWIFQGMLYANWRENVIKIVLDVVITLGLCVIGLQWWLSFFIAHTLNYCLNAQAKAIYNHMGAGNKPAIDFYEGVLAMKKRLDKCDCMKAAIAYGSLSRGCYKPTSDIDVRFVPKDGEWNWWKACFWTLKERIISFFTGFPLDSYVFSLERCKTGMRSDELPIIVLERDNCAKDIYYERVEWEDWCKLFKKEQGLKD